MRNVLCVGSIALLMCFTGAARPQATDDPLYRGFLNPPDDARPMMRWWWFGPAVTKPELQKELETMRAAGIGGVEIQPVYPLELDDAKKGIRNLKYMSPEFLDAVGFANRTARGLGMRVDITLGSGWPYGGPKTTLDLAAGRLRLAWAAINGNAVLPVALDEGESIVAAFAVVGNEQHFDPASAQRLIPRPIGVAPPGPPGRSALYFIAGHTGQQVKRAAFGAEGNVLDHFNRAAIDEHLTDVAAPLVGAFGDELPYSVFSDSLEVVGSDWTANLPEEFRKRRGYDLIPHLPELVAGGTPEADAVRHDWGKTLAELIRENYLTPLADFAAAHHTLFRSQTYGDPAVTLADEATPQLIEGEGMQWRQFSYCRWATSAAHLYGRNVVSAETWTWLHSPAFRATPLDLKAEADRMFLLGVNQLVGHGWPYSPPEAGEPGQAFYAAAVLNQHNPWFAVMPEITKYLTRVSWLLRQGKSANDVAILLPEDDAQAAFTPGHVSVVDEMAKRVSPQLMAAVLDAGYNVDYIDAATIEKLGTVPYPVLILPSTDRISLSTYKKIEEYADAGGKVIAVGKTPSLAPGLMEQGDSAEIAAISERLFRDVGHKGIKPRWTTEAREPWPGMAQALRQSLKPDFTVTDFSPGHIGNDSEIGVIHRKLPECDIYFVANTENYPFRGSLGLRSPHRSHQEWRTEDGSVLNVAHDLILAPYESRVFVFCDSFDTTIKPAVDLSWTAGVHYPGHHELNLSEGWQVRFGDQKTAASVNTQTSWTELSGREHFSGEAVYTRDFSLDETPKSDQRLVLDFGEGKAIVDDRPAGADGMHALLDPPIREAAIVYVNGKRAGALWHPPYRLDITSLVKPGANRLEVHVYNTAINELAGQPPRDYTAPWAKYGKRFEPQDMDKVKPEPSGLLGPVRLMTAPGP
ncbi:MAG TPA: glycosyl hydrolase [Terracidiphilus sp.]|jgi:hypothetical protein